MLKVLERTVRYGDLLDMIYVDGKGQISKRRIKVLQIGEVSFRAYCHMRGTNRTFTVDNVLALVPVVRKERMVI
ncbi:transcriptional regulator [Sporosarcina sp. FSL K6-1508]|uniref:transcriptional regulator n=1 Tax=Sporosarcina sp. FSL K6-1508 TaxID=2921553 RepID=UPI0030FB4420